MRHDHLFLFRLLRLIVDGGQRVGQRGRVCARARKLLFRLELLLRWRRRLDDAPDEQQRSFFSSCSSIWLTLAPVAEVTGRRFTCEANRQRERDSGLLFIP